MLGFKPELTLRGTGTLTVLVSIREFRLAASPSNIHLACIHVAEHTDEWGKNDMHAGANTMIKFRTRICQSFLFYTFDKK